MSDVCKLSRKGRLKIQNGKPSINPPRVWRSHARGGLGMQATLAFVNNCQ